MNTQGGYGNFSTNGLPGTSNTFTVNGGYEGDPYLNLNNSGATNLLLGNNDVETVTVTTNSYDAAFGGLGGAQVNEISRSGGNKWHGNATYWWNGRAMNANSWFNKHNGSPRNFDNANQWAAAIGGPIKKDKIFGFVDYRGYPRHHSGHRTCLCAEPAFQAAILDPHPEPIQPLITKTPTAWSPTETWPTMATLQRLRCIRQFSTTTTMPGTSHQVRRIPAILDTWIWNGQTTNFGREWLMNDRVDFNLSSNDHLYVHSKVDKGVQPTQTSFLDPIFDAQSPQPSYEGQLSETHTFTPNITNQFLFAASYYRAIFTNTNGLTLDSPTFPIR